LHGVSHTTCRFLPESPRWLIAQKRNTEARTIFARAARMNGVIIDEDVYDRGLVEPKQVTKASVLDLFSHWRLAKNTLIVFFCWLAEAM
jgi:OCT family organic cation transporter-like MFS transporter 1